MTSPSFAVLARRWSRSWLALLPVVIALGLQSALWPLVRPLLWIFFYPAVFLSSVLGGRRMGCAATAVSLGLVGAFFVPAESLGDSRFVIQAAVFASMGVLFALINGQLHDKRTGLETHVAERTRDVEQTNDTLRQREAELRLVADTAQVGLVLVDQQHRYRFANRAYQRILGLPDVELVGRTVAEMVPAAYESQIRPRLERAFQGEQVKYELHLPGAQPQGEARHFNVSYEPMGEGDERVVVVAIAENSPLTKNAEVAARLAAIVESSSDAIIGKDLKGIITSWNAGATAVFGYTADEMVGRPITRLIPADRLAEETTILDRIRRGEPVRHFETVRQHRDGRLLDVSLTVSPICDPTGTVIGASKVARDITAARQIQRALADSEERLRLAVDAAQLGTWESDFRTGRVTWSAQQERMMGYAPGTFPGTLAAFRSLVHPDDRAVLEEALRRTKDQDGRYETELRFVLPNGRLRWGLIRGRMFFDADGKPERMVGIELDVTERRLAEEALRAGEARYRSLVQNLPAGVFRKDRAGRYEFVSERFCAITDLPAEQFIGRTANEVADLLAASERKLVLDWRTTLQQTYRGADHHWEIMETGRTIEVEEEWVSVQGAKRCFQAVKTPVFGADGTIVGTQGVLFEITDRKRAELALRESQLRFFTAFQASPVAIAINRRRDLINLEVNDTFLRVFECTRDDIIGFTLLDAGLVTRDVVLALRAELDSTGRIDHREITATTRTGRERHLQLGIRVITLGGETCALTALVDISEAKQAEQARERKQRHVALLGEISRRLVLSETAHGTLAGIFTDIAEALAIDIYANYMLAPTGDRLLLESSGGLDATQERAFAELPIGVSLCGLVAERREPLVFSDLPRCPLPQAEGIIGLCVKAYAGFPLLAGDRLIGTVSFGSRRVDRFADDELHLMKAAADQVAAALERSRLLRALIESEDRFREVVENIQEVFWMSDVAKSQVIYLSPGFETIWGISCASVYASSLAWAERLHPDDRARVIEAARTKQASGGYDETYRVLRPDGTVRWVHEKAFPVMEADGSVKRVVGVAEDITERKTLEDQFLRAQRLEAIGSLASGIAHDLNNILAPVLMVPPLLRGKLDDSRDLELLSMMENSAQRGAGIIRQLLTFSRGIAGNRGTVQMRHLLKEMLEIMRETFPREIAVEDRVPADLWPVNADATQIHQVLMNLCVNARDAMPAGGRLTLSAANVELGAAEVAGHPQAKAGAFVRLTVGDTGEGIAPENIDRIFEPFYTTKEVGKGTGLGLSTALGIVRSHQGFVTVESERGRGSTFAVYLPVAQSPGAERMVQDRAPLPRGAGEGVLLVDDEESIRIALRTLLERQNFRVLTARNGQHALTVLTENARDVRLVLLDLMMPVMGGIPTVRALRSRVPELPIVVMSGKLTDDMVQELHGLGVQRILPKPFGANDVIGAVAESLRSSGRSDL